MNVFNDIFTFLGQLHTNTLLAYAIACLSHGIVADALLCLL